MSDNSEKDFDPEVSIKFTADKQVREYFRKKGVIDEVDEKITKEETGTVEIEKDKSVVKQEQKVETPNKIKVESKPVEVNSIPEIKIQKDVLPLKEVIATEKLIKSRLIFFDYKSEFFAYLLKELDQNLNYTIVEAFEDLPKELQENENLVLFLNFSAYPKLCSQLIPKVKAKFDKVRMILVAKNLTAEKIQAHKQSAEGVHDYLSFPFSRDDFFRVITNQE